MVFGIPLVFAQEVSDDLQLDDNLFDVEFVDPGETADEDFQWFDPFTFKLSYQTISQINRHHNKDFFGAKSEEKPTIENNRLSLLVKYQHAFAAGWLLQGNAHGKVYLRRDYEYVANNQNTEREFRINELFVQRSDGQHSIKLGRQTVVWGEAVGNSVLDVINTTEIRDLSIVNIEDARLNQSFLLWDIFRERSSISTFVNLYPQFNPAIKPGSPLYIPARFKPVDFDRDQPLFELGSQYRWSRTGSDFALMAAYLYENQLRYDPPPGLNGNAVPVENNYWLIGFSANRAIDKLLVSADVAYSDGVFADTFNPLTLAGGRQQSRRLGTSLGVEYGVTALQQVSFSIRAETFLDQDQFGANQQLINDDVYGTYLLRYSNASTSGDLSISSTLQRDRDGLFLLGSLALNYVIDDNWALFSQLVITDVESGGPAMLDDDVRLELTLHFSF